MKQLRETVIQNLSNALNERIGSLKKDGVHARQVVCSMASGGNTTGQAVARVLKVDRRFVYKAIKRRVELRGLTKPLWTTIECKRRSDSLPVNTVKIIYSWWHSETTVSPNKKDVVRHRVAVKKYVEHPCKNHRFKLQHLDIDVGLSTFERLKPWYVKRLKEHNTCSCKYHVEIEELRKAFNNMRALGKGVQNNCSCKCDICGPGIECPAHLHTFQGLTPLWECVLCSKASLDLHFKLPCLLGDCQKCGVSKLKLCP